jgi:tetratricopeptide (TPR) repeat protein
VGDYEMNGHMTAEDRAVLEAARTATVERPDDPAAWLRYGRLLFEPAHDSEGALGAFRRALDLDPRSVEARFWLAAVHQHDFESAKARALLEEALEIDPSSPECLSLLPWVLGDLHVPHAECIAACRRAIAAAPSWRSPREALVTALVEAGEFDAAADELAALDQLPVLTPPTDTVDRYFEEVVTGRALAPIDLWRDHIAIRIHTRK